MFAVAQVKVSVDTTALKAAIAAFEALDDAHYNAASFAKANAAYEAAKAELNANYELTAANQRKVDAAASALNDAIAVLSYLPADISELNTVLYQAKMMQAADYVDFSDVEEAIAAADEFLAGSYDIRNQATINELAQNLSTAIAALALAPADFTAIDNAIAAVPKLPLMLQRKRRTPSPAKTLTGRPKFRRMRRMCWMPSQASRKRTFPMRIPRCLKWQSIW